MTGNADGGDAGGGAYGDRLEAVEQEIGFAGRAAERLEQTVAELSSQVYELNGRLDRLEKRLADLTPDQGEDAPDEPPPHSHKPL